MERLAAPALPDDRTRALATETTLRLLAEIAEEVRTGLDIVEELATLLEAGATRLEPPELREIADGIDRIPVRVRLVVLEATLAAGGPCAGFAEVSAELRPLMRRCGEALGRIRRLQRAAETRAARRAVELSRA